MKSYQLIYLIGVDYFRSIINNKVTKTKEKPMALDTKVGWIRCWPVNNTYVNVNNSVLITHLMTIQFEFIDADNV